MKTEVNEESIKKVLNGLFDVFHEQAKVEFDDNFPKVREWIDKYCKGKPYNIAEHFISVKLNFESGCEQFLPQLEQSDNKKYNFVIGGIFDSSFIKALNLKCDNYTDMVRKYFNAVYKQLTTGEIVNVYEEYTKEEIAKYYNDSKWEQKHRTLEETLEAYVGKPKLSLKEFKTSNDIIEWFYTIKTLYRKICKVDINEIINNFKGE